MSSLGALVGSLILKPALLLGVAAVSAACLRRHTAATRHAVWTVAILATLALPVLASVVPPLRVASLTDRLLPWVTVSTATTPAGPRFSASRIGETNLHRRPNAALLNHSTMPGRAGS